LTFKLNSFIIILKINENNLIKGEKSMKKIIFKTLFNVNHLYSLIWEKATGKDKSAFREESKIHEMLLAAMSAVM
jgi:hypothetical protein